MFRTALAAVAMIAAGATAASAYDGGPRRHYGYRAPPPVIVMPHRPMFAPPVRHHWRGYHRFHRNPGFHPGYHRRWGW